MPVVPGEWKMTAGVESARRTGTAAPPILKTVASNTAQPAMAAAMEARGRRRSRRPGWRGVGAPWSVQAARVPKFRSARDARRGLGDFRQPAGPFTRRPGSPGAGAPEGQSSERRGAGVTGSRVAARSSEVQSCRHLSNTPGRPPPGGPSPAILCPFPPVNVATGATPARTKEARRIERMGCMTVAEHDCPTIGWP